MRYIILFLVVICIVLWMERYYWRRVAQLMEGRLRGTDRSDLVKSLLDAWIDGRIEARLRKRR
jgi:hypothetical protein